MKLKSAIRAKYSVLPERHKPIAIMLTILICLLLIILLLKGCQAIASIKKKSPADPMMIHVGNEIKIPEHSSLRTQMSIKTVTVSTLPHIVSVPGMVEADPTRTVNILPPLTGRIMSLNVNLGDRVKKNQVLAVISSPDLGQASSDNDKAIGVLKMTTEALKRAKDVNLAGGNSIKVVQQAQNDYIQALAEATRTQAKLKTLGHNTFSLLTITAPIEGRVTSLNYGVGSYISDATATLMSIANIDTIWITANVPENLAGIVAKDQAVDVRLPAYPEEVLHGKVSFVNALLDPDTHRNKTRIVFPNPNEKLQPNMFATVNITIPQPNQVMIPLSAILMNNDTTSVYVETSPWCFQARDVQLGAEDGDKVRVLSGLTAGERIVESGGIFIND